MFEPIKKNAHFTIAGESFYLADGLFGLALTPKTEENKERYLVFRPLASKTIYYTRVKDVLNSINYNVPLVYTASYDVLPSQASTLAFSSDSTLFYGACSETAIGCWNFNRPLNKNHLVSKI